MPLLEELGPTQEQPASGSAAQPRRSLARHLSEVQLLLDQAPSFLALTQGPSHIVAITNDAYLNLVGRRREDVVGRPIVETIPELREQGLEQLLDAVIATRKQRTGAAVRVQLKDQATLDITERRVDFTLQPIFDSTNETVGIFIQGLDVTDRELAIDALQRADRNKDDFLATLAHEMLSPLSASRVGLDLLKATITPASPDTARALALLQRQYSFLAALVEDLLDVSRIRLGKLLLSIEDVVLEDAVRAAIETCQHRLDASSHVLRVVMPPSVVKVRADPRRLVQVLTNLLINSAKFTPPGGSISIEVQQMSDAVEIVVSDTGKGMAAEDAERAFELFHQNSDADRASGGLGIGLALVRQLVELQGGAVRARSPGVSQGTYITVRFPRPAGTLLAHSEQVAGPVTH
jgi:PAS domain S-box-containing protein